MDGENREINRTLKMFGLTNKETVAYTTLLSLGNSTAYAVARASDIKPSTAQVVLKSLDTKGIVVKVPNRNKCIYAARLPETVLEIFQDKVNSFENALPLFKGLLKFEDDNSTMHFYSGIDEIKKALYYKIDSLRNTKIYAFYGSAEHIPVKLNSLFLKWNNDLVQRNISTLAIAPEHNSLDAYRQKDALNNRLVKTVHGDEYFSDISLTITQEFVILITLEENPQCIIIENPLVTKTFTHIFKLIWSMLDA